MSKCESLTWVNVNRWVKNFKIRSTTVRKKPQGNKDKKTEQTE